MRNGILSPAPAKRLMMLAVAVVIGISGCRGDRNNLGDLRRPAQKEMVEAKEFMTQGRYTDAKLKFEKVLEEIDGTNSEARFGVVLSELLQFSSIIRVVSQLAGGDALQADENEFLGDLINDLLSDLIARFDRMELELTRLKADATFQFTLPNSTPVFLTSTETPDLDLQGEWDRGDVFLVDVFVQAVLGLLNTGQAIDLRANFLGIFNQVSELDIGLPEELSVAAIEELVPTVQLLLTYILNDPQSANFLGLDPGTGEDQLSAAGTHFANAVASLRTALFFASQDIEFDEDQSDDIVAFLGRGVLPEGDDEDADLVQTPIDPSADLCVLRDQLRAAEDAGDDEQVEQILEESTFNFEIRALTGDPLMLSSGPEVGCVVTKLLTTLLRSDDPRMTNDAAVAALGPDTRLNLLEDVITTVLSLIDLGELTGLPGANQLIQPLIEDFLGNAIELDLGAFFHTNTVGIRGLLPAWDTPGLEPDPDAQLLWMELECGIQPDLDAVAQLRSPVLAAKADEQPFRVIDRILCDDGDVRADALAFDNDVCPEGADVCDITHFPAQAPAGQSQILSSRFGVDAIPNDGIEATIPYIAFQDPSFSGVLYLDLFDVVSRAGETDNEALVAIDDQPGFRLATQAELNAYLTRLLTNVLPLVSQFL